MVLNTTEILTWGTGAYGRLGHGDSSDRANPTKLHTSELEGKSILCVSGGLYHSAVVTEDNELYVFGTNATGCLGVSGRVGEGELEHVSDVVRPIENTFLPLRIRSLPEKVRIVQVSVSGDLMGAHSLAVSSQGRLYSWGVSVACGLGPLKDDIVTEPMLVTEFVKKTPNSVSDTSALERVAYASAGGCCSAIVTTEGSLFTFGITASGRLGYRDNTRVQWRPRRVDKLLGDPITSVSAGGAHMLCVTSRGRLYVWGDNGKGQLGLGDLVDRMEPNKLDHPRNGLWSACIAAGESHSLAVDVNGKLFSFGACGSGAIGRGGDVFCGIKNAKIADRERALCISFQVEGMTSGWAVPREVGSLADYRVVRVAAGAGHSVAVTSSGLTFAWGSKSMLGMKDLKTKMLGPISVPRLLGPSWSFPVIGPTAIACGSFHALIASSETVSQRGFAFLIETMARPFASASHDSYVLSAEGQKLWLCSAALQAVLIGGYGEKGAAGWELFLKPQLRNIDEKSDEFLPLSHDLQSLSTMTDTEHERIESVLDAWVRESSRCLDRPEIPENCLFERISAEILVAFFESLLTDAVPRIASDSVKPLLRLVTCCQLERPKVLLQKRLFKILKTTWETDASEELEKSSFSNSVDITPVPVSAIPRSLEHLYSRAITSALPRVVFHCGPPIFKDTLSMDADVNPTVDCDVFLVQGWCGNVVLSESDSDVARNNNFGFVKKSGQAFHVDCKDVPLDVVKEVVHFMYFSSFPLESVREEPRELGSAVRFWISVAIFGLRLGSECVAAAAIDAVIDRVSSDTWSTVAVQFTRLVVAMGSLGSFKSFASTFKWKQLRESVVAIASVSLADKIMDHPKFNNENGYVYSKHEIVRLVNVLTADLGFEDRGIDDSLMDSVKEGVVNGIETHCHAARELRRKLEFYQMLNLDPTKSDIEHRGNADGSSGSSTLKDQSRRFPIIRSVMNFVHRLIKSMRVPLRDGPSILSTFRDLAALVAVIAVLSAYSLNDTLGYKDWFSKNMLFSRFVVVGINMLFVIGATVVVIKSIQVKG